jgi:hypothetical protein
MKKSVLLLSFIFSASVLMAQENQRNTGMSFGYQLVEYQQDFGVGLQATSPFFLFDHAAVRVKANQMWFEHMDESAEVKWTSYQNLSIGLIGVSGYVGDFARVYSEGGVIWLFPSSDFSDKKSEFGGYGLVGLEVFTAGPSVFVEGGGMGTGAQATELTGSPIYSNGFVTSVGLRFHF